MLVERAKKALQAEADRLGDALQNNEFPTYDEYLRAFYRRRGMLRAVEIVRDTMKRSEDD